MKYNMKYFDENKTTISATYVTAYELDGHRIGISACDRCSRSQYYNVCVDGITIATRCKSSNTIRLALKYMNEHFTETAAE